MLKIPHKLLTTTLGFAKLKVAVAEKMLYLRKGEDKDENVDRNREASWRLLQPEMFLLFPSHE
jgi:hypothetical protein